jgi:hypothetical protein
MNKSKNISIIFGAKGLIGSELYNKLKIRGDNVVAVDIKKLSGGGVIKKKDYINLDGIDYHRFLKKLKNEKYNFLNLFFLQMYIEKNPSNSSNIKNANLSPLNYRNKIIDSWVNSDPGEIIKAIKNQILFIDGFLKKIINHINDNTCKKNIIFFGSIFQKIKLLNLFYKNENFFFKNPAYVMSKKTLEAYQSFLSDLFFYKNTYINTISPGVIENGQTNGFIKHIKSETPISQSLVSVSEIVSIALFLSDMVNSSSAIHNQNIYADRGWC